MRRPAAVPTRRPNVAAAVLAVVALATAAAPARASAADAYGRTFAGQAKCLECHKNVTGRWQVGTYVDTAHGRFVADVR
ncbi:MAG TPA: hypothetical protein VF902_09340, partial [Coriobacteriia bacterium]